MKLTEKARNTYKSQTKANASHYGLNGFNPLFSAMLLSLTSWLASLSIKIKANTIKLYLTGVRSSHVDLRYDDLAVFHHPQL